MEQLLVQLIQKTILQCAEDHRLVVSNLNGEKFCSTSVFILAENSFNDAEEIYLNSAARKNVQK